MLIYVKDVEAINSSVFHRYTSTLIGTLKSYNLTIFFHISICEI